MGVRRDPAGSSVAVAAGDTPCFDVTGVQVNDTPGLSFASLDQDIAPERATRLLITRLAVFKSDEGTLLHDDLSGVRNDQHHLKTTDFSELTDSATDAQIPNDITILFAETAGDADTLDGSHADELEESAELDSDIAGHTSEAAAHHARYTDDDARAIGQ